MCAMTNVRDVLARMAAVLGLLLVAACGGGGGGSAAGSGPGAPYTRICASGDLAPAAGLCGVSVVNGAPNEWTCTLDNSTGLMWMRSSTAFVKGTSAPPPGPLCGRAGWSAPSVHELMSLVRHGQAVGPAIDTVYFPGTPSAGFITREIYLQAPQDDSWTVSFEAGTAGKGSAAPQVRWVAAVRQPWVADPPESSFGSLNDVLRTYVFFEDTQRRKIWLVPRAAPDGSTVKTWEEAAAFATTELNAKAYYSRKAWRLPTAGELDTLVNRSFAAPALPTYLKGLLQNPAAFSQNFWTSTSDRSNVSLALAVNLEYGDIAPLPKSFKAGAIYVLEGYE